MTIAEALSDREARTAAAGGGGCRIGNLEHAAHQIVDEVDLAAAQIFERDLIDQDGCASAFEHEIVSLPLGDDSISIGEARASAAIDADAQNRSRRLGFHDFHDTPCGIFCQCNGGFDCDFAHLENLELFPWGAAQQMSALASPSNR